MLILTFIGNNAAGEDFSLQTDRVYTDPSAGAVEAAGKLFPEKNPVIIPDFAEESAADAEESRRKTARILAAFDALLGNFRVLYQDEEREVRIIFLLPAQTIRTILSERLTDAAALNGAEERDPVFIVTHAEGGRLVPEKPPTL
ncbi:MAG: hypothetical protein K6G16_11205 [Lachnospiraceae bacterium]|nr:hypothetical protein [Lachnospiraceae bacterium]